MKLYKSIILILILCICLTKCNYCSAETCRRCCMVTPTGCINNQMELRGKMVSFLSFCGDCDCDDEGQGCGWKADNFGRLECTSCDNLKSMNTMNNVVISGCGHVTYNGDVVYTSLPSPYG